MPISDNYLMRRDAHPKHHGCVATTLEIENQQLPQEYRLGLFAKNQNYRGVIRFFHGKRRITAYTALDLAETLGTSAKETLDEFSRFIGIGSCPEKKK